MKKLIAAAGGLSMMMMMCATAEAGTLSKAPGEPRVSIDPTGKKFEFFAKHTQVFAGDIDAAAGFERRALGTGDSAIGWSLKSPLGPLDFDGELAGVWTEDHTADNEDEYGVRGSFAFKIKPVAPGAVLFGEYGPGITRSDGSASDSFTETFEVGGQWTRDFGGVQLSLTPSYVWEDSEADEDDAEGVSVEAELSAPVWRVNFVVSAAYAEKTYSQREIGLASERKDEAGEVFFGLDLKPWLPERLKIAKLTLGPTYVWQESNSLKPDKNFSRWQFAPTIKFAVPLGVQ